VFTALNGSITSPQALANPYDRRYRSGATSLRCPAWAIWSRTCTWTRAIAWGGW